MKAKTLSQVIAAEAGGKTRNQRLADMKNIYSSMVNRAKATGVAVKDVFSVKSQYNAYNSAMPPGTSALTGLAKEAIDFVDANGVTHPGMYYATPAAVSNLPAGLVEIPGLGGVHKAFYDPKNRAVVTKVGAKPVNTARLASSLPATMELPGGVRPADVAALPSAERFGYKASAERFGRVGIAEQVARAVSETSPLGEMTMAGDVPSQAPGAVRDSVARDMIDTAQWSPAGFAKPALANAAISRALSPPSVPNTPTGGIMRDMIDAAQWSPAGFARPELANAAIGRALAPQTLSRPSAPPSNFSGGTPAISPIGSAPVGQVSRAPLGPALARPSAPPSNFAKGTVAAPTRQAAGTPTAPHNVSMPSGLSRPAPPSLSKPSAPIAERFGPAPTLGYSGKTAAEIAAIGDSVRANPAAPSTASYGSMRGTVAQMAGPPAARPTANVASSAAATATARPSAPARPAAGLVSAYAPSATPSSSLGDFAANGVYTGAATNAATQAAAFAADMGRYGMYAPPAAPAPALAQPVEVETLNVAAVPAAPYTGYGPTAGPPAPPRATAYDVYSGMADTAYDNTGNNRVSSIPGGTSVTNKYGATTGMVNGYQTAVGSMPSVPGMSMPSKSTIGGAVKGGALGASVGGPIGGVIGALAGALAAKAMAERNGTATGAAPGQSGGGLGGFLGGLFGGRTSSPAGSSSKSSGASKSSSGASKSGGYSVSAGSQSLSNSPRY